MGISKVRISQIVNGHAPISTEMALRLAKVTRTSPEEWLTLQMAYDLYRTRERLKSQLDRLRHLTTAAQHSGTEPEEPVPS